MSLIGCEDPGTQCGSCAVSQQVYVDVVVAVGYV
jgi:hypothetical protein